ncbi:hypothetical protein M23134_04137 [Microscilla marina ATCC 23134]|uniref:Uncharacterized protein n=1 Tax=Microscilla marina ATCC 23134 TaxID=313606 RepID=A1ZDZ6_MICM2|nr:hypothetical protein M23134_04137 [Microscilla marina ATCC 23134]
MLIVDNSKYYLLTGWSLVLTKQIHLKPPPPRRSYRRVT